MQTFQPLRGSSGGGEVSPPPLADVVVSLSGAGAVRSHHHHHHQHHNTTGATRHSSVVQPSFSRDHEDSVSMSSGGASPSPASPPCEFFPATPNPLANNSNSHTLALSTDEYRTHLATLSQQEHELFQHNNNTRMVADLPRIVSQAQPMIATAVAPNHTTHRVIAPVPSTTSLQTAATTDDEESSSQAAAAEATAAPTVVVKRRQKRLERNRESARLSRRRRKHYLEVLEENVVELSQQVDAGRRAHVARALWTIQTKRSEVLTNHNSHSTTAIQALENELSRTSTQLQVVNTFQSQQLQSLALPPTAKFILWLSLQNEPFFRGGRASSERLSAARIGERMLSSGTDRVTPHQNMWPLFCNEVGLSYEQEEKVRCYQKMLLQTPESWLHRHTAFASGKTMLSLHDATQALTHQLGQRSAATTTAVLSEQQRLTLATWSTCHRERLAQSVARHTAAAVPQPTYPISPQQHPAANLYSLHDQLEQVLRTVPRAPPLVSQANLKKLSRRPLFESLVCGAHKPDHEDSTTSSSTRTKLISRDNSFASTGSLKRGMNEMSMCDDDDCEEGRAAHVPMLVSPQEAQAAAHRLVESTLGHLRDIIPAPPTPTMVVSVGPTQLVIPAPTPVHSMMMMPAAAAASYQPPPLAAAPTTIVSQQPPLAEYAEAPASKHVRRNSFLPPHLNVVPEEMWPADGSVADEFFMNLIDGDWAVGEGLEMDLSTF